MTTQAERRAHPRAPLTGVAYVYLADQPVECVIVDVSAVGMAVRCPEQCELGRYVQVRFRLSEKHDWHDADGVVARVELGESTSILGIEFSVIEAPAVADIVVYIEQRRALGLDADTVRSPAELELAPRPRRTAQYGIVGTREHPKTITERNTATGEHPRKRNDTTRPTEPDLEIDVSAFDKKAEAPASARRSTTRKMAAATPSSRTDSRRTTEQEIQRRPTDQLHGAGPTPTKGTRQTRDIATMESRRGVSGRPIGRGPARAAARQPSPPEGPSTVSGGRIDRRLLNLYLEALAGVDKSKKSDDDA